MQLDVMVLKLKIISEYSVQHALQLNNLILIRLYVTFWMIFKEVKE